MGLLRRSPVPGSRRAARDRLVLTSDDMGRVATARRELEAVADGDIPRVAASARTALQQASTIRTSVVPPLTPKNEPGSVDAGNDAATSAPSASAAARGPLPRLQC
jgi:hypothetical protein